MKNTYYIDLLTEFVGNEDEFHNGLKLYCLPIEDRYQSIQQANLTTSVPGEVINSCDEQDNPLLCFKPAVRFKTLKLNFTCQVKMKARRQPLMSQTHLIGSKLFDFMPWQRVCLFEYTQPIELPEHVLYKLHRYAMAQVTQSDFDPIKTLRKLNKLAHQKPNKLIEMVKYTKALPQSSIQHQLMLFVLLCRILSIPTRYVRGYVKQFSFTKHYHFKVHLWAEVYLPYIGWIGFDPKYYRLANQTYIRCAVFTHFSQCGESIIDDRIDINRPQKKLSELSLAN